MADARQAALRQLMRQREDDPSRWDYMESNPETGSFRVAQTDTPQAARLSGVGVPIASSGEEWGAALQQAQGQREARATDEFLGASGLAGPGVRNVRMRPAGAGFVAEADTDYGPRTVELTPEQASALQYNEGDKVGLLSPMARLATEVRQDWGNARSGGASMARGRALEEAGLLGTGPAPAQDWGDGARGGATMARGRELDAAGLLGMGAAAAPTQDWGDSTRSGASMRTPPAPARRPTIAVGRPEMGAMPTLAQPLGGPAAPRTAGTPTTQPAAARDEEFAGAQDAANRRALMLSMIRAGSSVGDAIAGTKSDTSALDALGGAVNLPVENLVRQRAMDQRKRLEDPSSPESKRLQAAVGKALPGVYTPEELSLMTAADEERVLKVGDMRSRLEQRRAEQAASAQQRQEDIAREDARLQSQQGFQARQAAEQRAFQRELAQMNNAADLQQAQARAGVGMARGTTIPGLEIEPGAAPTAEDAKKVKTARESAARMRSYVNDLRTLHQRVGTEFVGEDANRMRQLAKAIQIEAKNIAGLGALSGPDQAIMEDLSGTDPTSLSANIKGLLSGGLVDSTQSSLDQLDKWVMDSEGATKRAYGYRDAPGAQPQPLAQRPAAAPAPQRVERNGKTYEFENGQWYEVL